MTSSQSPSVRLQPGDTVGILGGGQLGRMLAVAAAQLGLRTHIFCPERHCPAAQVSDHHLCADYDDKDALAKFARCVDIITYEFENVPATSIDVLTACGAVVAPGKRPLEIAQDRLHEKEFVRSIGGQTPAYHPVECLDDLHAGLEITGVPAILKTRRFGYDGKGQTRIMTPSSDLPKIWDEAIAHAWAEIGARPSILEAFVPFVAEISVIAARGWQGEVAMFDPPANEHRDGILFRSKVPSGVATDSIDRAKALTRQMIDDLGYVGVIGVEFFVLEDGSLFVNEFAPRVHNSGHWTEGACTIDQFEQHVRAVCGWPMGDGTRHSNAMMENLIGTQMADWPQWVSDPSVKINLYGKNEMRAGRKMGHATKVSLKTSS